MRKAKVKVISKNHSFVTSDLHFNHNKEFIWKARGFSSVKDMNIKLVSNWNSRVKNEDTVFVLGDMFMGRDTELSKRILQELKGKIYLILGNHDGWDSDIHSSASPKVEIFRRANNIIGIERAFQFEYKGRLFYLSHYPTITTTPYSSPQTAVFNLFGHTHSRDIFYNDSPFMFNVSVDAHNNYPVSMDEVSRLINLQISNRYPWVKS